MVQAGGNPYGVGYPESFPPGAPYAYGPIALAWYWPAVEDPKGFELLLACGMVAILGVRGRVLGLAIYAVLAPLLVTAADGSNDTSAGIVLLIALLVAQRSPIAGGFLLALAAAFKPYAAAWLPPLMAYGGVVWPLLAFVLGSLVTWGPAAMWWGPANILDSLPRGGCGPPDAVLLAGLGGRRRQRDARVDVAGAAPGHRCRSSRSWASSR